MKQSPKESPKNFEASKFSGDGFLGSDQRPVDEIIAHDARTLDQAGIPLAQLAAALETAYLASRDALGAPAETAPEVIGEFEESRGRLPCPFRGCGVFEKGEAVLTDRRTNDTLIITALGIHLIKKHGFFQGSGSRYRIDPLKAAKILRII
ncbi:MAG: hypothetical protein JW768_05985 [Chitinispirillaceae bacterium]|nr:hypothetical protein [Chitinispirillaceae bacterium]